MVVIKYYPKQPTTKGENMFYFNNQAHLFTTAMDNRISDEFQDWSFQEMDMEQAAHLNIVEGQDAQSGVKIMGSRRHYLAVLFPCYSDPLDGLLRTHFSKSKRNNARIRKVTKIKRVKPSHKQ